MKINSFPINRFYKIMLPASLGDADGSSIGAIKTKDK